MIYYQLNNVFLFMTMKMSRQDPDPNPSLTGLTDPDP